MKLNKALIFILVLCISIHETTHAAANDTSLVALFNKEMKGYRVEVKDKKNNYKSHDIREIIIYRSSQTFIIFEELPKEIVDSAYLKDYSKWLVQQSCSMVRRDSTNFYNFSYGNNIYFIRYCSQCSDQVLFNNNISSDNCYWFRMKFLAFLRKHDMKKFTW